jgi:2-isopropylmalate synthase
LFIFKENKMSKDMVKIFDTTLRDGEQSPGCSMVIKEKIQLALQLEKLGVDIIEAGFAAASKGDFEAISQIAGSVNSVTVCSLARALENDIEASAKAIERAKNKRIHTFIATSPIHMEYKLKMSSDEVVKKAVKAVEFAKSFVSDVEFSCEDAGRSDISFLKEILDAVISAGATTLNIPDTVGYLMPGEIKSLIKELKDFVGERATISVHCHNDLGLGVANSLASVEAGARQVECTINGIGERAGNAALEEIVMALKVRKDLYGGIDTAVNTKEIYKTSKLLSSIISINPQPNKAIVGKNAFAHESGIHQDGILKHKDTYEIMSAESIGLNKNSLVLGKHSGRAAFRDKVQSLGFTLNDIELNKCFEEFKTLADKKKEIYEDDIRAIISNDITDIPKEYEIVSLQISDCTNGVPSSAIKMRHDEKEYLEAGIGDGTMDAIFKTVDRITNISGRLNEYKVQSVSKGKDSLAKVTVKVKFDDQLYTGHGLHIDTMFASANAYVNALNSYIYYR